VLFTKKDIANDRYLNAKKQVSSLVSIGPIGTDTNFIFREGFRSGWNLARRLMIETLREEEYKYRWSRKSLSQLLWELERTNLPSGIFEEHPERCRSCNGS